MAKKKNKSAEDIIYEIKDLLDDLELKINPDEELDENEDEEDFNLDKEEEDKD
jgi:hypothetical protein